jgi:Smg-4/UPF3 family
MKSILHHLAADTMDMCLEIKQVGQYKILCISLVYKMLYVGNESQAVVEFAPYQKVPSEKKKADARTATIEKGAAVH